MAKKYHKWTDKELALLAAKPDETSWEAWIEDNNLTHAGSYKAIVHRATRLREEMEEPRKSRRCNHKWTQPQLSALMRKPAGVMWKDYKVQLGLGEVRTDTVITRYYLQAKKQSAAAQCTPEPRKASNEQIASQRIDF